MLRTKRQREDFAWVAFGVLGTVVMFVALVCTFGWAYLLVILGLFAAVGALIGIVQLIQWWIDNGEDEPNEED